MAKFSCSLLCELSLESVKHNGNSIFSDNKSSRIKIVGILIINMMNSYMAHLINNHLSMIETSKAGTYALQKNKWRLIEGE